METTLAAKPADPTLTREARARAAPLVKRLLDQRTRILRSTLVFGNYCHGLVEFGVPLGRATIHMRQLHPQLQARSMLWLAESGGAFETGREHGIETSRVFLDSPLRPIYAGESPIRRRLEDPACPVDFPILHDLKAEGWSDYYMTGLPFSVGTANAIGFGTNRPGGFSELDIATIEASLPAFGAVMEMTHLRRTARTLLQTYLGAEAGERVLAGDIKRGDGEVIDAVLWYCDLRNFTPLSESLPLDEVIALLNDYFETMARPVKAQGGEILKFMGDAMLAIFPLAGLNSGGACKACVTALETAEQALAGLTELNQPRAAAGKPPLKAGIALARGEVMYGNIGDPERLDFTVIGPAVNLATRLEDLTRDLKLDPPIVYSARVAANSQRPSRSLGHFALKGIGEPQEAFTLA
jgi:adenylate cyclase